MENPFLQTTGHSPLRPAELSQPSLARHLELWDVFILSYVNITGLPKFKPFNTL